MFSVSDMNDYDHLPAFLRLDAGNRCLKLSKQNLDFSERNEIFKQFVQQFENANPRKTFDEYAIFAKSIPRRFGCGDAPTQGKARGKVGK
jgi:hypothetical protein